MSIITTGAIIPLLKPGLDKVGLEYSLHRGEYLKVYTPYKSFKRAETDVEIMSTGYAVEKEEGKQIAMSTMGVGFTYDFVHKNFGIGFEITEEAVADNQYKQDFYKGTQMITDSYEQTREVMAMQPFNQAFNVNVPIGDGQPLVSANHPTASGDVFSNYIGNPAGTNGNVNVAFSETGIEQALIMAQRFKTPSGLMTGAGIEKLLLPVGMEFDAERILNSTLRSGTANNDANAFKSLRSIPKGYITNHFLTSPYNWFALTDVKGTRKHFIRAKLDINMVTDPKTKTLTTLGNGRYSFGFFTPLGVLGATGA